MTLPNVIGATQRDNSSLSGIIYEIVNTYKIKDPISSKIVIPSASSNTDGNVRTLVLWDSFLWRTVKTIGVEPYFQLKFPKRYVIPTAYSLRGILSETERCYTRKWVIYGFNKGEENDRSKWDVLAENTSDEHSFCGTSIYCNTDEVYTYQMKPTSKGYNYIRLTALESSCGTRWNNVHLATSGVDIYGTLVKPSKITCRIKRSFNRMVILFITLATK